MRLRRVSTARAREADVGQVRQQLGMSRNEQREPPLRTQGSLTTGAKLLRLDSQIHHRVNLPDSVARQIVSPVGLIFGRMANVPKCPANDPRFQKLVESPAPK